jgi:hypothetical protein
MGFFVEYCRTINKDMPGWFPEWRNLADSTDTIPTAEEANRWIEQMKELDKEYGLKYDYRIVEA